MLKELIDKVIRIVAWFCCPSRIVANKVIERKSADHCLMNSLGYRIGM